MVIPMKADERNLQGKRISNSNQVLARIGFEERERERVFEKRFLCSTLCDVMACTRVPNPTTLKYHVKLLIRACKKGWVRLNASPCYVAPTL